MSADLSPETESFIQQEIALGVYPDRAHAIEAGVDILRQKKWLRDRLAESQRQIRDGEYVDYDEDGLRLFFDRLKERATRRTGAN